jgi:hypothetical protein
VLDSVDASFGGAAASGGIGFTGGCGFIVGVGLTAGLGSGGGGVAYGAGCGSAELRWCGLRGSSLSVFELSGLAFEADLRLQPLTSKQNENQSEKSLAIHVAPQSTPIERACLLAIMTVASDPKS